MKIDREELRRHYARLSDDGLRAVELEGLVPEARECFEAEWKARGLDEEPSFEPPETEEHDENSEDEERVAVCVYHSAPPQDSSTLAVEAVGILTDAGIPCEVETKFLPASEEPAPRDSYEHTVVVPVSRALEAEAILESEMHNQEIEEKWRAHFATLSDRDLRRFDVEGLFAGLLDRISRVKRAYKEEISRRS